MDWPLPTWPVVEVALPTPGEVVVRLGVPAELPPELLVVVAVVVVPDVPELWPGMLVWVHSELPM